MTTSKISNRLIHEKSPYLLQHAHNPVDWYPWGNEAFEKAKSEDKPIFLSIGYSTCHWCHVMERESFEDEEVAEVLNKYFISIKVDKEERPDIDSIYMSVCQALTGSGGWPMTIIMTPEKKPFFAGTYFPKEDKYGRIGIMELLLQIQEAWVTKRNDVIKSSNEIIKEIQKLSMSRKSEDMNNEVIHKAFREFKHNFDNVYGGFGSQPKFPTPHNLGLLLRYWNATGIDEALSIVEKTLECMYKGGTFDHIGFGFSRYSTDRKWLAPHFEKMLYDNALLSMVYAEAYQATGKKLYKEVADKVFTYIIRDMTSPEGGFYSAEDADSEGVEGKFYLWEVKELENILGAEDAKTYINYYDITQKGNFEGKNIPNLINKNLKDIEENKTLIDKIESIRQKLFNYREKRIHPYKDNKILTSWNGLMIASLAYAGRVFDNQQYISCAEKAINFILDKLVREDGRLLARYREGDSAYLAYLDDYAFIVWGLIELYEATYNPYYLKRALELNADMIRYFGNENGGGLFLYGKDGEELIIRPKEIYDGAIPSGNSVAVLNMLRLSNITGDQKLKAKAAPIFSEFAESVKNNPSAYSYFISAFLFYQIGAKEIIIVGEKNNLDTKNIIQEINKNFIPFSTVVLKNNEELNEIIPMLKEHEKINNAATAYVCQNFACSEPVNSVQKLNEQLDKKIKLE